MDFGDLEGSELSLDYARRLQEINRGRGLRGTLFDVASLPDLAVGGAIGGMGARQGRAFQQMDAARSAAQRAALLKEMEALGVAPKQIKQMGKIPTEDLRLVEGISGKPITRQTIFDAAQQKSNIANTYDKTLIKIQNNLTESQRELWDTLGDVYRTYIKQQAHYKMLMDEHLATGRKYNKTSILRWKNQAANEYQLNPESLIRLKVPEAKVKHLVSGFLEEDSVRTIMGVALKPEFVGKAYIKPNTVWSLLEQINPYTKLVKIEGDINKEVTRFIKILHSTSKRAGQELNININRKYTISEMPSIRQMIDSIESPALKRQLAEVEKRIGLKLQEVSHIKNAHVESGRMSLFKDMPEEQLIASLRKVKLDLFDDILFPKLRQKVADPIIQKDKSSWWFNPKTGKLEQLRYLEKGTDPKAPTGIGQEKLMSRKEIMKGKKELVIEKDAFGREYRFLDDDIADRVWTPNVYKLSKGTEGLETGKIVSDVGADIPWEGFKETLKRVRIGPKWLRNWVNASNVEKPEDLSFIRRAAKKYLGWMDAPEKGIPQSGKGVYMSFLQELAKGTGTESQAAFRRLASSIGVTNIDEEVIAPLLWAIKNIKFEVSPKKLNEIRRKTGAAMGGKAQTKEGVRYDERLKGMFGTQKGGVEELLQPTKPLYQMIAENPKYGTKVAENIKSVFADEGGIIPALGKSTEKMLVGETADVPTAFKGTYDSINLAGAFDNLFMGSGVKGKSLLSAEHSMLNAVVPNRYSIDLMTEIFGEEIGMELLKKRHGTLSNYLVRSGIFKRYVKNVGDVGTYTPAELAADVLSMPKSLLASFDVSAPMRQGFNVLFTNPREWRTAWKPMIRAVTPGGEAYSNALARQIETDPDGWLLRAVGGQLTGTGKIGHQLSREDRFMSATVGNIFPWVRPSERAFTIFMNKLRLDTFKVWKREAEIQLGRKLTKEQDSEILTTWAKVINNMTGRGPLPFVDDQAISLGKAGTFSTLATSALTLTFFSPRMFTSRIALPYTVIKGQIDHRQTPVMRRSMWRTSRGLVSFVGGGLTAVQFASMMPGDYIDGELDPKSPNFLKIRMGNTWYSPWAQYDSLARAVVQVITGKKRAITTDYEYDVNQGDILLRFFRSKLSPTLGTAFNYALGTTFLGEEANIWEDMKGTSQPWWDERGLLGQLAYPIFISTLADAWDAYKKPVIPYAIANEMKVHESDEGTWDHVSNLISAVGSIAAESTGIGTVTYITLDDITKELTGGAHQKFTELPPTGEKGQITQPTVRRIKDMREAQRGVIRQGPVSQNLQDLRIKEQNEIDQLPMMSVTYGNKTLSIAEWVNESRNRGVEVPIGIKRKVADEFFNIRLNYSAERRGVMRDEDAKFATPEATRLKVSQMDEKNQWLYRWYDIADQTKGIDEYSQAYDEFIKMLRQRPNAEELVNWMRMNVYNIQVPPEILDILPEKTRIKYSVARGLRQREFGQEQFR